jgi:polar amino acid transport system substrate-binding protein
MKLTRLAGATLLLSGLLSGTVYAQDAKVAIPAQKMDQALHDKLPDAIKTAGEMTSVNSGSFPPYEIVTGSNALDGATADLETALGQLLGIKIKDASVNGLSAQLSGIGANRYQLAMGPVGDFKTREDADTFVDWVQEYVVFAVEKGNPKKINSLDDACGDRIAVQAGGSAEKVIKDQAAKCTTEGKKAIEVQSYADQPTAILAVRSKRADAFFSSQAPLTYFVQQSGGQLELAAVGKPNGFSNLFQGAVVPKDSPLAQVLLGGIQQLMANGTYQAIMKKWGLENNMISKPGINLGGNV